MYTTFRDEEVRRLEAMITLLQSRGEEEQSDRLIIERDMLLRISDKIEEEVIRHLAHKWRQPLNVISLMALDLQESWEYGELDDVLMKQTTEKIMEQVQVLSKIIDDCKTSSSPTPD